jgi:hypothetical protein
MRQSKFEDARDVLVRHTDNKTLELDTSGYYESFLRTFSKPEFRESLDSATVFLPAKFYGFYAFLPPMMLYVSENHRSSKPERFSAGRPGP